MRHFACFFFIFCYLTNNYAQKSNVSKEYKNFLYEIAINHSSSNFSQALYLADSLYIYAPDKTRQLQALMLKAKIYNTQEKTSNTLETLKKALDLSKQIKNYEYQAITYQFLASLSRKIGFYDEGRMFMEEGFQSISKVKDPLIIEAYTARANIEWAEFEIDLGNYSEAIRYLDMSREFYARDKEDQISQFYLSKVEEAKGRSYSHSNNPEEALESFRKSQKHSGKSGAKHNFYCVPAHQGLAEIYLQKNELDSARTHLQQALKIVESSTRRVFKEELYNAMSKLHQMEGSQDSSSFYFGKYEKIKTENKQNWKHDVNYLSQALPQSSPEIKKEFGYWWIVGGGLFFLFGGTVILLKNKENSLSETNESVTVEKLDTAHISQNTEKRIREGLDLFIQSKKFLNPKMTFSSLVNFLDTNPKYLNYYFRENLQTDYTTYINDLRIKHITERIDKNQRFRNLRISRLAEEAGFSSHSNFSANFKRTTGMSPSEYIESKKFEETEVQ